jgi:predicted transcriptional regulator
MSATTREIREIVREEPAMRRRILAALRGGPRTVPEIAEAIGAPANEAVYWIMGMRRYGWISEVREAAHDGYFRYELTGRES